MRFDAELVSAKITMRRLHSFQPKQRPSAKSDGYKTGILGKKRLQS